jgi:signal transduction histidine kinase
MDAFFARFSVKDQGIGIALEDQRRIFERFERASSARNYGGLGLGLYIVREIVEAHGGKVWVQSEVGKGSTFTVEVPRQATASKLPLNFGEKINNESNRYTLGR